MVIITERGIVRGRGLAPLAPLISVAAYNLNEIEYLGHAPSINQFILNKKYKGIQK